MNRPMVRHPRALPIYTRRRGITSVLAMLFLVLIGTLALGFYSTVTTATQLAKNDQRGAKALMAAESGLQFMRYQLAHVDIPPNTEPSDLLGELYTDLKAALENTGNLGTGTVAINGNTITIPGEVGRCITTNAADGSGFRVSITDSGGVGEIVCTVVGQTGSGSSVSSKGVRLDFTRQPIQTDLFDNAVASKGKIVMQKGAILGVAGISDDTIANITSAKTSSPALTMTGGTIGGNVGIVDNGLAYISGGTVHGTSNLTTIYNNHVKVTDAPDFPVVDTSVFAPYATNTYVSSGNGNLTNVRIPANTGTSTNPVKFTGNKTIEGILYVESPNVIEFRGNTTLAGFIVFEGAGTSSVNKIDLSGNFSVGNLPAGSEFDALRTVTGVAIVAPTTHLNMTGSADSQLRGNVIVGSFRNAGSADIQIDRGTLITMNESGDAAVFNGKDIRFTATGKDNQPSQGVMYDSKYIPVGGSYRELN